MKLRPSLSLANLLGAGILVTAGAACNADTDDLFGGGGAGATAASSTASTAQSGATTSTASGSTGATMTTSGGMTTTTTTTTTTSGGPTCGNGVVDQPDEECDGADLQGHTCSDLMFSNPAGVACGPECKLDFEGCQATCGDTAIEPTEDCDDGNTIDTDTCSAKCHAQGDCQSPIQIALPLGTVDVIGKTSGASLVQSTTCQDSTGPELVFRVTPAQAGFLTIWTDPAGTTFDSMIYVRDMGCGSNTDLACGDNNFAHPDLVSFYVGPGMQPLTVVLDGYNQQLGTFSLHFDLSTGVDCNDPVPILASGDTGFTQRVSGTTVGSNANLQGTCGGMSNDVVYQVKRIAPGPIAVDTTSVGGALNSITYARTACNSTTLGNELACSGPINDPNSSIDITAGANPLFVVIDAQATQGAYTVDFDPSP